MTQPHPDSVHLGQESVWDDPRLAVAQATSVRVVVEVGGIVIADTRRAVHTLETNHPPSDYIPRGDVIAGVLVPAEGANRCAWKGVAKYFDMVAADARRPRAAWSYPDRTPAFEGLRDHVAFYAGAMGACWVGGDRVEPHPNGFYGGWITAAVAGRSSACREPPMVTATPVVAPDGRYLVVRGRLWRRSDPRLSDERRQALVDMLMDARRAVGRALRCGDPALSAARTSVDAAKTALGERGPVWWDDGAPDLTRRMVRNSPYADWHAAEASSDEG